MAEEETEEQQERVVDPIRCQKKLIRVADAKEVGWGTRRRNVLPARIKFFKTVKTNPTHA